MALPRSSLRPSLPLPLSLSLCVVVVPTQTDDGKHEQGSPIAGYLLEAYGGADAGLQAYRPAMFYAGSLALASSVMVLAARVRQTGKLLAVL